MTLFARCNACGGGSIDGDCCCCCCINCIGNAEYSAGESCCGAGDDDCDEFDNGDVDCERMAAAAADDNDVVARSCSSIMRCCCSSSNASSASLSDAVGRCGAFETAMASTTASNSLGSTTASPLDALSFDATTSANAAAIDS